MNSSRKNGQDRVLIFDTTLRDGEQSPGATMSPVNKLEIALLLDEMGVDIIEAGFPIASEQEFECVRTIAGTIKNATVCGLARCHPGDIDRAGQAIAAARRPRIHTFISTSELHMTHKLQMNREQVIEVIDASVRQAREYTDDVQWSPEDGTRSDHDFLCQAVATALEAGATTINIPDTVGYAIPNESAAIIAMLCERVPAIRDAVISTHCHNDLGMAVANSLAAVSAGARQVECTINGLGERAGNAALEEVVMALRVRRDAMPYETGVDSHYIMRASRMVADATGFPVQYNKAVVGKNAFSHESGIHQDGMIKHADTYEIMRPEDVGLTASSIVLGKHSGRAALKQRLATLGYDLGENMLGEVFVQFKRLAERKTEIFDDDLIALMGTVSGQARDALLVVHHLAVTCGSGPSRADVTLAVEGVPRQASATGSGPVEATYKAVEKIFAHGASLQLYQVHAVTGGRDAQATVSVRLERDGQVANGNSADTDTILASLEAYVSAINNLERQCPEAIGAQG